MCNVTPDVMKQLEQTVRNFLAGNRMFTGYDVTIETRNREKIQLRHDGAARGAVHEMTFLSDAIDFGYEPDGSGDPNKTVKWAKTQIPMGKPGAWAFVFHPANLDPNGYQPIQGSPSQQASKPAVASSTVASTPIADQVKDSGGQNTDGTFTTDYRGRLMVGAKFLHGIGLEAGDSVHIITDSNNKTITLTSDQAAVPQPGNGIGVSMQIVEYCYRVYLSQSTIRASNIPDAQFKIEQKNAKTVEISA